MQPSSITWMRSLLKTMPLSSTSTLSYRSRSPAMTSVS